MAQAISLGREGAFPKIDLLATLRAKAVFVKFIRKNFIFLPAFRALANKRLQFPVFLKAGTMLRCCPIIPNLKRTAYWSTSPGFRQPG